MLIDPHCHLDDPRLSESLEAVLERARACGVTGAIVPSYGPERWSRQGELLKASTTDFALWGGFGLHPWAIKTKPDKDFWIEELEKGWQSHALLWGDRLKAIGEFGLDRSRPMAGVPWELQEEVFRWHLGQARKSGLPIILHLVRCDGQALRLLSEGSAHNGVVHGFGGHRDTVPRYLETGLCLSFGSELLRNDRVKEALRAVPLERLMFETDAPRGASVSGPLWGPADLHEIARMASQVLGKSVEYLLARHMENCARVFGLAVAGAEANLKE